MSKISQLTNNLSKYILTNSQLSQTKGRGNNSGMHTDGSPGLNGKGNAKGHSNAMSNMNNSGKCPPPFELTTTTPPLA